jgi:hypothetical protein
MLFYIWNILAIFLFITLNQHGHLNKKILKFGISGFILFGNILKFSTIHPYIITTIFSIGCIMITKTLISAR